MLNSDDMPILSVRGLSVRYGGREKPTQALEDVSLDVGAGQILGILGESGSGKSTLATSLLGLLPPKATVSGSIWLCQGESQPQDLLKFSEARWRSVRGSRIATIFQEPGLSLSPFMRVGQQILEVLRAHDHRNPKERCQEILREVQLPATEQICKAYPHQLSGGQLQRIVIAQALACKPQLLIADEPTRSLDATLEADVVNLLQSTRRKLGCAVVFVTHNPALLTGFADRVAVMYAGRIVEQGPAAQVFRRPLHPYTRGLLELVPRALAEPLGSQGRLPVIPGNLADSHYSGVGCAFGARCAARLEICKYEFPAAAEPEIEHKLHCFNYAH